MGRRRQLTVADTVAQSVASAGVEVAFGHPGGEVVLLIDALRRAGVPFVLTRHENTAAFMAAGYGELTGRPGVCIATLGPGATNMVTGAASALLERAPLLLLTGALARSAPAGTTHQALDLNALYRPVTKLSVAVTIENAAAAIGDAIALAQTPPQGPVHLSVASDVAGSPATRDHEAVPGETARGPAPGKAAIATARALLARSTRPAMVVGLGALRAEAAHEVRALARATGAVVATLPKAKGSFPEDDPNFVGTLEMAGDDIVIEFLRRADALILAGVDVVEFDKPWRLGAPAIHVDSRPKQPGYWNAEVELTGDIAQSLAAILPNGSRGEWTAEEIDAHRRALASHLRTRGGALQAWQVVEAIRASLPRETIAACDVGAHKMLVGQAWPSYEPRTFFVANGLSSMGYSVPVAAAARLALPGRPVVSFVGDGGLGMYLGELETLRRVELDLPIVVFVDGTLELIRRAQVRRGLPGVGTSFSNPDFAALGRAFGIQTFRASSDRELQAVLPAMLRTSGVRLLAAEVDGNDYRF